MIPKSLCLSAFALGGLLLAIPTCHKPEPIPQVVTPAPASKTPASTEAEPQDVAVVSVPSFIEPPAIELPAEAAQVSVVAPACAPAYRTQPATVPRQYVPQRRRLFGRWR